MSRDVGEQGYHGAITPPILGSNLGIGLRFDSARTGVPFHTTTNVRSLSTGFYEQMFAIDRRVGLL
jgi:hypothetical protein